MSACTCETYGHCHACRSTQGRTEPRGAYSTDTCVWCQRVFVTDDMFIVGNYADYERVCGPDCPKRPLPRPEPVEKQVMNKQMYRVQFSVEVEANSIEHAKNIVPYELRKVPRLEFESIFVTQKVHNK